ncbi:MAG TPA: CoA transferase [Acidimicrobiales bacterium]|nr:CoA transferase [Acidimicrobiales bacterium]
MSAVDARAPAPTAGALAPYRVVDLSTARGWLTGRILADLGADVVKVEPPGGDPGRRLPPFADDEPGPERSLQWWFANRGKRSVCLDLDDADGVALARRLLAGADVVVESFDPGYLAERGLGYDELHALNPRLVVTSVTPFGQDGPYAGWAGPDLVLSAMGGPMWLTGEPDRPPVRISVPQYEMHGAAEGAVATAIALYHAAATGEGQHVDVSCQLAAIRTLMNATAFPYLEGVELSRQGREVAHGHARFRMLYACADGHVSVLLTAGALGGPIVKALLRWIGEEEGVPEHLSEVDWVAMDFAELATSEEGRAFFAEVSAVIDDFFARRTKAELYAEALARGFLLAPANTVADIRVDEQLAARGFFVEVDHPERPEPVVYPGPWARLSETPLAHGARAPRVGEHNRAVLVDELGLGPGELRSLHARGVV